MIPVFEPKIDEEELKLVSQAIKDGEISGTFGKMLPEFEKQFANYCDCEFGSAVTSGTTALHLSIAAMDFNPGDEVLVSASTNIATALGPFHNNLIPIPVDSENETWNMDLNLVEDLITPKTKAIIPVHLFGHPVKMDELKYICDKQGVKIIEDCAEAHGATVNGEKVGSFSDLACFSFYANKIITTGEGGMIVSNNKKLIDKVNHLKNLAFTTPRFKHFDAGYNFRMSGMQAALGIAQLGKIDQFIADKKRIANTYNSILNKVPGVTTPVELDWASNVYWMYAITINEKEFGLSRDELMSKLREAGIDSRTFFCPMNAQPVFSDLRTARIDCPVAERLWEEGLYLPSSTDLSEEQIHYISNVISI